MRPTKLRPPLFGRAGERCELLETTDASADIEEPTVELAEEDDDHGAAAVEDADGGPTLGMSSSTRFRLRDPACSAPKSDEADSDAVELLEPTEPGPNGSGVLDSEFSEFIEFREEADSGASAFRLDEDAAEDGAESDGVVDVDPAEGGASVRLHVYKMVATLINARASRTRIGC